MASCSWAAGQLGSWPSINHMKDALAKDGAHVTFPGIRSNMSGNPETHSNVYIYVYVYTYVYIYIYMCIYIYTRIYI